MYFFEYLFAAFLITVSIVSGRAISDIGNPVAFDRSCGRPESSYVCDPDDLLTVHEGKLCCLLQHYLLTLYMGSCYYQSGGRTVRKIYYQSGPD